MAFIQRKPPASTTEQKLKNFFEQNLMFALFLTITTIIFCIALDSRYKQSGSQQLELHYFYQQFEKLHTELTAYTTEGDTSLLSSMENSLLELKNSLNLLKNIQINTVYHRDITDAIRILERYEQYARKVVFSEKQDNINEFYYLANHSYYALNAEFRNLNYQILEFSYVNIERLHFTQRIYILTVSLLLVIIITLELLYSQRLTHLIIDPIQELTSSIRNFSQNNLKNHEKIVLHSASNEEMNLLVQVFNTMLLTIQKQMKKIQENADIEIMLKEKEVENLQMTNLLRTSELKSLQMQINPHFLFNTLNMISQTAYIEGADETSVLLDSMAAYLRYTLDYATRTVPLAKELENLGTYVSLLEHRFAGRIHFTFDLDESFHHILIPSLILQPILENAIVHGVGMYLKDGHVIVRTEYNEEKNAGVIHIIDNGAGLDAEDLEKIRIEMKNTKNAEQKIGLSNVYARLQIFFHQKAEMEIHSIPGQMTEITVILPCTDLESLPQEKERTANE